MRINHLKFMICLVLAFPNNVYAVGDGMPPKNTNMSLYLSGASIVITLYPFYETTVMPTALTQNQRTNREHKTLLAAKEDALTFIAINGNYRTVRLEKAMQIMRKRYPIYRTETDMNVIKSIADYR